MRARRPRGGDRHAMARAATIAVAIAAPPTVTPAPSAAPHAIVAASAAGPATSGMPNGNSARRVAVALAAGRTRSAGPCQRRSSAGTSTTSPAASSAAGAEMCSASSSGSASSAAAASTTNAIALPTRTMIDRSRAGRSVATSLAPMTAAIGSITTRIVIARRRTSPKSLTTCPRPSLARRAGRPARAARKSRVAGRPSDSRRR